MTPRGSRMRCTRRKFGKVWNSWSISNMAARTVLTTRTSDDWHAVCRTGTHDTASAACLARHCEYCTNTSPGCCSCLVDLCPAFAFADNKPLLQWSIRVQLSPNLSEQWSRRMSVHTDSLAPLRCKHFVNGFTVVWWVSNCVQKLCVTSSLGRWLTLHVKSFVNVSLTASASKRGINLSSGENCRCNMQMRRHARQTDNTDNNKF